MKILSFSRSVPYDGIFHAGGEYALRHVRALLSLGHEVTVVAPDNAENRHALECSRPAMCVQLVPVEGSKRLHPINRFNARFRVARPYESYLQNVAKSPEVLRAAEAADLLEYQWTEFGSIHLRLPRGIREGKPSVLVAHDVLSEKAQREAAAPSRTRCSHGVAVLKALVVHRDEHQIVQSVGHVLTFSDKDARQLRAFTRKPEDVTEIRPPLEPIEASWKEPRKPTRNEVLMVGAFFRPENSEGAKWFMRDIWPKVLEKHPDARLKLVGHGPDSEMLAWPRTSPSVAVTGYVQDLSPFYRQAALVVVPVLAGAGVKFKTVTAMLWGVPIVGTPVGVEGIVEESEAGDLFAGVVESAEAFAHEVNIVLADPDDAEERALAAKAYAMDKYGAEEFSWRLSKLYQRIIAR